MAFTLKTSMSTILFVVYKDVNSFTSTYRPLTDHLWTMLPTTYWPNTNQIPTTLPTTYWPAVPTTYCTNQTRVLARPKWQGTVLRPVVLVGALSFYLSALSFFRCPVIFESPLVSSGFYQCYFELEVAESIQLRRIMARFSCTTLLFVSEHRRHLAFMSQIPAWEWGYANGIWRNVIFAIVYLESGARIYEY